METIELKLDESNEFFLKIAVQGAEEAPTSIRFVCEAKDLNYSFNCDIVEDGVQLIIPPMKGKLKEGNEYRGVLEVILEGRYFTPFEVNIKAKESLKVFAESMIKKTEVRQVVQPAVVSATIIAKPPAEPKMVAISAPKIVKPAIVEQQAPSNSMLNLDQKSLRALVNKDALKASLAAKSAK